MQCGDIPLGCHVLHLENDVMAVWVMWSHLVLISLKLDVWYAVRQKVIVRCAPCSTYKVYSFTLVNFCGKSSMLLWSSTEMMLASHYCGILCFCIAYRDTDPPNEQ